MVNETLIIISSPNIFIIISFDLAQMCKGVQFRRKLKLNDFFYREDFAGIVKIFRKDCQDKNVKGLRLKKELEAFTCFQQNSGKKNIGR